MGKDEQLFLDDASSHMHDEQTELLKKVKCLLRRAHQTGRLASGDVAFAQD
jgi:hypothetical protein